MKNANRIAYYVLRRLLKYSSPLIGHFQKASVKSLASAKEMAQPVFILGVPRSGTTVTYQLITNYFDVLYPDNLVHLCRENPYVGFWLSNTFFGDAAHNCFQSNRGNTLACGLHAPNQAPIFWHRYIHDLAVRTNDLNVITEQAKNAVYNSVFSVINRYKKPLVMKGAAVGNNLNIFLNIFPRAKFIQFKRDPLYNAQSLLITTRNMGLAFEDAWMKRVKPYNHKLIKETPSVYKKIALYIHALLLQNKEDLKSIPKEHVVSFSYEDLSVSTNQVIEKVAALLGAHARLRKDAVAPRLENRNVKHISDEDFEKLSGEIHALDWQNII